MFFRSLRRGRRPPGLGFATGLRAPCLPRYRWLLAGLLLPGDGLLGALPRPGVGPRALPPYREAPAVAEPGVTADLHLPLDVLGDLPPQVTLDLEVLVDPRPQACDLLLGEVPHPGVGRDLGRRADLLGARRPDAEDVGERDLQPLLPRNVDPGDTCHAVLLLALALLVPGVLADDHHHAVAPDHLAFLTDGFHTLPDLHRNSSALLTCIDM